MRPLLIRRVGNVNPSRAPQASPRTSSLPGLHSEERDQLLLPGDAGVLLISERALRRVARQKISGSNILAIVLRQALCESWLRIRKNLQFRVRRNGEACEAYCAMSLSEF